MCAEAPGKCGGKLCLRYRYGRMGDTYDPGADPCRSVSTVFQIPWTMLPKKEGVWPTQTVSALRELGFKTAAMALKEDSVGIDNLQLNAEDKLAIILGTEGDGLARDTIADCDYTVMIPMAHGVDSLNVAAAGAVAFWQLGNGCSTGK